MVGQVIGALEKRQPQALKNRKAIQDRILEELGGGREDCFVPSFGEPLARQISMSNPWGRSGEGWFNRQFLT